MATTTAWLVLRAAATTDGYYYGWLLYRISRAARNRRAIFYCISRGAQTRTHVKYDTEWLSDCGPHVKYDTEWVLLRAATTTTATTIEDGSRARTGADTSPRNRTNWARKPRHSQQIYRQTSRGEKRRRELRHTTQIARNGHGNQDTPTTL